MNVVMAVITLPIETKSREFDGKLWLSLHLANNGHSVILGDKGGIRSQIRRTELQPDLHIVKDHAWSSSQIEKMRSLKKANASIAALEAEGGVFSSDESFLETRCSKGSLRYIDHIFAWGSRPAQIIAEGTSFPEEKISITGNPRFDLLHPELRDIYREPAERLIQRFGDYILFTTNFTRANPYNKEKLRDVVEKQNRTLDEDRVLFQRELLDHFLEAITSCFEDFNSHSIIIRPHPSEDHEFYREYFANNPSVIVKHTGDVRAWIYAADCVIQNGSTVGIEAAMLNTPVIAYEPETNITSYDRARLPNLVSKSTHELGKLLEQIDIYISQKETYEMDTTQKTELQKYFENVEEPASLKIVNNINKIEFPESGTSYPESSLKQRLKKWVVQTPVAPYIQQLRGVKVNEYRKQKFPGLSIEEVRTRLQDFEEQIGEVDLEVRQINYLDDVYLIEQK